MMMFVSSRRISGRRGRIVGLWFFFFSSRRRHTRLQGDWSSDVCSSDLLLGVTWNLIAGQPGEFRVTDVLPDRLISTRFLTAEAFEHAHPAGEGPFTGLV